MAGRIRDEDVVLVRERAPIADVIGESVQLRPAGGGRLKGLCPFHDERTASFSLNSERGLYKCFGCGAGGDGIRLWRELRPEDTFAEAVAGICAVDPSAKLRAEPASTLASDVTSWPK